jgi:hypothetical protein
MSRKRTRRKHFALVNPIEHAIAGAAITDGSLLDKLRVRELSAIEAFRTGRATAQEWRDLADLLNICETLATDGIGPEAMEPCQRAQDALGEAHRRLQEHGRLAMTGPELQALRDAYDYADLQRISISRLRYEQAIAKTANRIRSAHPSVKVCID